MFIPQGRKLFKTISTLCKLTDKSLLVFVKCVVRGFELEVDLVPALVLGGLVAVRGVAAVPQAALLAHQLDQLARRDHLLREQEDACAAHNHITTSASKHLF